VRDALEVFLASIPDWKEKRPADLIDYFVYFLTEIEGLGGAAPAKVRHCFAEARIAPYSNIPAYLSRNAARKKGVKPKFIRSSDGYRLERSTHDAIGSTLSVGPGKAKGAALLAELVTQISDPDEKRFLNEAVDCYRIDARRAAIVMVWNLTMFHLQRFVLARHKAAFETALAKNKDRRIKVKKLAGMDDFSDIPEGKFIEFLRGARIVSGDVRKILDAKLGIRNTYAHPNNLTLSEVKAADFVIDLVENVIQRYPV